MTCFRRAEEQYVWVLSESGTLDISSPLCADCSDDQQPLETIAVFEIEGDETEFLPCNCPSCGECET